MRLKILERGKARGEAIGIDANKKEFWVKGGDLCIGETIDVDKYESNDNDAVFYIHPKINYKSVDIFSKYFDKDGLVYFKDLKEVQSKSKPFQRIYELDNYWVFPESRIAGHVEYLYDNSLLSESRIKISQIWADRFQRVSVYSINYIDLLHTVIKHRKPISAWLYCEKEKDFNQGLYADMFVLVNINESDLQIQMWQIIGDGSEVLFVHGLLDMETVVFKHFDLATHYVDPSEIPGLIYHKNRMELINKQKWIRIDSNNRTALNQTDAIELIKMFFPMDHLVNEFIAKPLPQKKLKKY